MEFIVNEAGCRQLSSDMVANLNEIQKLISEIDSNDSVLRAALGEDYEAIARTVRAMNSEFNSAYHEVRTIISDMNEYMSRVGQARVSLG
ncbi:MAG: hypothetical protein LUG86_01350 [Oscillospiraceae bacterium]|nr:hypothetical protein [Oscillospiraceae bacterium]